MKIEDLKVGELYYKAIEGLIIVNTLYPPEESNKSLFGMKVGSYSRINSTREISLYSNLNDSYMYKATNEHVEEYLCNCMTNFNVGNFSLSISENDVYITGDDQQVSLNKDEVRELVRILNKEINL